MEQKIGEGKQRFKKEEAGPRGGYLKKGRGAGTPVRTMACSKQEIKHSAGNMQPAINLNVYDLQNIVCVLIYV